MADIKTETDTGTFLAPATASHPSPLHLPPLYDSPYISPQHCSSPPPAYTPLPKGEDAILHHTCLFGKRREPRRRRLVTVLSLIIMILLSITIGVSWKHWELVTHADARMVEKSDDSEFIFDSNFTGDTRLEYVSDRSILAKIKE